MKNRLKNDLIKVSAIGRPSNSPVESYGQLDARQGVTRPEGSAANKELRDFTHERMREAGLQVMVDRVGNIFGRREGDGSCPETVMSGSHLDSVINGGHLDGALGVFAGIEALRRMNDEEFHNLRPIEVVAFTGEEGSAFNVGAALGSAFLSGELPEEDALTVKNTEGRTLAAVLDDIGYRGEFDHRRDDIAAFIELHIEQGPVLDHEQIPIGVVERIAGMTWIKAVLTGLENHAGTTPMHLRQDALVAAADVVRFLNRRARVLAGPPEATTVGTAGRLSVFPNNVNVIPGMVELGLDIRDASLEIMQQLTGETIAFLDGLKRKYGIGVDIAVPDIQPPVDLSPDIVRIIEQSAVQTGTRFRCMYSGAGHDAGNMALIAGTGMIFVPSVKGISHSPMEWTPYDDIEKGVSVLTGALKALSGTGG